MMDVNAVKYYTKQKYSISSKEILYINKHLKCPHVVYNVMIIYWLIINARNYKETSQQQYVFGICV